MEEKDEKNGAMMSENWDNQQTRIEEQSGKLGKEAQVKREMRKKMKL